MGERGGRNLYCFVLNSSINYFDVLGLWPDPYPIELKVDSKAIYLNPVGRFIKFYTGDLGTESHTSISNYIRRHPGGYRRLVYDTPLSSLGVGFFSMNRPDIISRDMGKKYIWEIKPITHKAPGFWKKDDEQIDRYLENISDKCYQMGDTRDFFNSPHTDLPDKYNVIDVFGNEFSIRVYTGENYSRRGYIFYGLRLEKTRKERARESNRAIAKDLVEAGEKTRELLEKAFPKPGPGPVIVY